MGSTTSQKLRQCSIQVRVQERRCEREADRKHAEAMMYKELAKESADIPAKLRQHCFSYERCLQEEDTWREQAAQIHEFSEQLERALVMQSFSDEMIQLSSVLSKVKVQSPAELIKVMGDVKLKMNTFAPTRPISTGASELLMAEIHDERATNMFDDLPMAPNSVLVKPSKDTERLFERFAELSGRDFNEKVT